MPKNMKSPGVDSEDKQRIKAVTNTAPGVGSAKPMPNKMPPAKPPMGSMGAFESPFPKKKRPPGSMGY